VIPNGVDLTKLFPSRSKKNEMRWLLGIDPHALVICLAARFDPQKNISGFLEIATTICSEHSCCVILMCGRGMSEDNSVLMQEVANLGLANKVKMIGQQKDMNLILNGVDVLVSASIGEGWPNIVAEAMAAGTMCVATNVGDTIDLFYDASYCVDVDHLERLPTIVSGMLRMELEKRIQHIEKSRSHIASNFDVAKIAHKYKQTYEKLLG
jgi:glycosyltransferase involved in cell wall biosynthesis